MVLPVGFALVLLVAVVAVVALHRGGMRPDGELNWAAHLSHDLLGIVPIATLQAQAAQQAQAEAAAAQQAAAQQQPAVRKFKGN